MIIDVVARLIGMFNSLQRQFSWSFKRWTKVFHQNDSSWNGWRTFDSVQRFFTLLIDSFDRCQSTELGAKCAVFLLREFLLVFSTSSHEYFPLVEQLRTPSRWFEEKDVKLFADTREKIISDIENKERQISTDLHFSRNIDLSSMIIQRRKSNCFSSFRRRRKIPWRLSHLHDIPTHPSFHLASLNQSQRIAFSLSLDQLIRPFGRVRANWKCFNSLVGSTEWLPDSLLISRNASLSKSFNQTKSMLIHDGEMTDSPLNLTFLFRQSKFQFLVELKIERFLFLGGLLFV